MGSALGSSSYCIVKDQNELDRCLARITYFSCESYRFSRQLFSLLPSCG